MWVQEEKQKLRKDSHVKEISFSHLKLHFTNLLVQLYP